MAKLKLNLQMFAYDPNSIVDYLKSTGKDSSYSARKELAQSMGISNYSGTAAQNTQMLNSLKSGSQNNNTSGPKSNSSSGGSSNDNTTNPNVMTYITSPEGTLGPADYAKQSSGSSKKSGSSGFKTSSAYKDALEQTTNLLNQLNSGKTTYADQIKQLIDDLNNRDPFAYDMNKDPLFQQYMASALETGKMAMQNTMGQAAALTGGYGSTYATSAANQQYNAYIQDAYDNLPAYYQLAMQAYQMQGEDMYKQLAVMTEADAMEFDRLYNTFNANESYAQQLYGNEYGEYIDELNNSWREKEFAETQKQYASDLELKYAQLAQDQAQFDASLAQDQAQFDAQMAMKARSGSGGGGGSRTSERNYEVDDGPEDDYLSYVEKLRYMKETGKAGDAEAFNIVMDWMERGYITMDEAYSILYATGTNWDTQEMHRGVMS